MNPVIEPTEQPGGCLSRAAQVRHGVAEQEPTPVAELDQRVSQ